MLRVLLDKFWNEELWLPPNKTWANVTPGPDKQVVYTAYCHVWFPIPFALFLLIIRYVLEKKIFAPLGRRMGIVDARQRKVPDNPKLEAAYRANPKLYQLSGLAKQLDMSERQVERWWRLRRSQDKPSTLVKFCENMFKATFFLCEFTVGLLILWNKEWLWDIDYCYIGYLRQGITNDVWWFYMLVWTFYTSQIMTQLWDVKRKDFWQYVAHHFATIMLLQISWVCNLYRIGTLVVVSHDSSEIFLETFYIFVGIRRRKRKDTPALGSIRNYHTIGKRAYELVVVSCHRRPWTYATPGELPAFESPVYSPLEEPHVKAQRKHLRGELIPHPVEGGNCPACFGGEWSLCRGVLSWLCAEISEAEISEADIRREVIRITRGWKLSSVLRRRMEFVPRSPVVAVCRDQRSRDKRSRYQEGSNPDYKAAKAMKYAKCQRVCDCLFAVFVLLWFITRLGYFPFYIIWSTIFRAPFLMAMFPAIYILIFLLCILLVLHIFWTWLILQIAYKAIISGQMEGDIRSSSSDLSDSAASVQH